MQIEEKLKNIRNGSYIFILDSELESKKILKLLLKKFKIFRSDIFVLQEKSAIKIEKIRAIKKKIYLKPKGKYNLVYIFNASDLTLEASNSLLKILEEPPIYSVIILITENIGKIIPTIISRCQKIILSADVEKDINKEYIELLERIKNCRYIYEKFAIVQEIIKDDIDINKMLVNWIKYLKKDYINNLEDIKNINYYLNKINLSVNKKLLLENLFLKINDYVQII